MLAGSSRLGGTPVGIGAHAMPDACRRAFVHPTETDTGVVPDDCAPYQALCPTISTHCSLPRPIAVNDPRSVASSLTPDA